MKIQINEDMMYYIKSIWNNFRSFSALVNLFKFEKTIREYNSIILLIICKRILKIKKDYRTHNVNTYN